MENALAVANEIIRTANAAGAPPTQMKLQKLLFYAHGWHYAMNRWLRGHSKLGNTAPFFRVYTMNSKHLALLGLQGMARNSSTLRMES